MASFIENIAVVLLLLEQLYFGNALYPDLLLNWQSPQSNSRYVYTNFENHCGSNTFSIAKDETYVIHGSIPDSRPLPSLTNYCMFILTSNGKFNLDLNILNQVHLIKYTNLGCDGYPFYLMEIYGDKSYEVSFGMKNRTINNIKYGAPNSRQLHASETVAIKMRQSKCKTSLLYNFTIVIKAGQSIAKSAVSSSPIGAAYIGIALVLIAFLAAPVIKIYLICRRQVPCCIRTFEWLAVHCSIKPPREQANSYHGSEISASRNPDPRSRIPRNERSVWYASQNISYSSDSYTGVSSSHRDHSTASDLPSYATASRTVRSSYIENTESKAAVKPIDNMAPPSYEEFMKIFKTEEGNN